MMVDAVDGHARRQAGGNEKGPSRGPSRNAGRGRLSAAAGVVPAARAGV